MGLATGRICCHSAWGTAASFSEAQESNIFLHLESFSVSRLELQRNAVSLQALFYYYSSTPETTLPVSTIVSNACATHTHSGNCTNRASSLANRMMKIIPGVGFLLLLEIQKLVLLEFQRKTFSSWNSRSLFSWNSRTRANPTKLENLEFRNAFCKRRSSPNRESRGSNQKMEAHR